MYAEFEQAIDRGVTVGSVPGMKDAARHLAEMARELPADLHHQLDQQLSSKFGKDLRSAATFRTKRVQWLLEHGIIENEDDHELLVSRVHEISQDPSKQAEVEAINALLARYEPPTEKE
jgi:hypothetical protein